MFEVPKHSGLTPGNKLNEMTATEWRELNGPDEPLPETPRLPEAFWEAVGRLSAWLRDFGHLKTEAFRCDLQLVLTAVAEQYGFGKASPCENAAEPPDAAAAKARVLNRCPSAGVCGDATGHWIGDHQGAITTPDHRRTCHEDELWIAADKVTAHMPDAVAKQPWEIARDAVLAVYPDASAATSNAGLLQFWWILTKASFASRISKSESEAWIDAASRLPQPQTVPNLDHHSSATCITFNGCETEAKTFK